VDGLVSAYKVSNFRTLVPICLFLYVKKMGKIVTAEIQTASVAYFRRKIQLSGFFAYPDGSPSQLTRISGVLLYFCLNILYVKTGHSVTIYIFFFGGGGFASNFIQIVVFGGITPYSRAGLPQRFGEACCLDVQYD
jgi:hypothetical protein